jgi:hypothetical protein
MSDTKISELPLISQITGSDFFPLNQSSSLTTYRGTVTQLRNYIASGSFSGSFSGSNFGSLLGTASFATSASHANTSVTSTTSVSASVAISASYAANSQNALTGNGTAGYIAKYATSTGLNPSSLVNAYNAGGLEFNRTYLYSTETLVIEKPFDGIRLLTESGSGNQALIFTTITSSGDRLTSSKWDYMAVVGFDGGFNLFNPVTSKQYSGLNVKTTGSSTGIYPLIQRGNTLCFWPYIQTSTAYVDGRVGIGAQPRETPEAENSNPGIRARLHLTTLSQSSLPPGLTGSNSRENIPAIIVEQYRGNSNSSLDVFCISGSGNVDINGRVILSQGSVTYPQTEPVVGTTLGQRLSIDATNVHHQFIQVSASATASITMSKGQTLTLMVSSVSASADLNITGSIMSGSFYYGCPIVWPTGSKPPLTSTSNRADMYHFYCVKTGELGPKGGGAAGQAVIYATAAQNFF